MSYSSILLDSNILLSWPYPFTGGIVISDINDIEQTKNGFTLTLPPANLVPNGTTFLLNNTGLYDFSLLNNAKEPTNQVILPGEVNQIYLTDSSTVAGVWQIIPFGGGVRSISTLSFTSGNESVTIFPGTVNTPSPNVDFQLSPSLQNINRLNKSGQSGFLTIVGDNPLQWGVTNLTADSNISISGTPPSLIRLERSLTGLTNVSVGEITLTGNSILSTNDISINGLIIDSSGNIASDTNSGVARAQCFFQDNNNPTDNITINDSRNNVASVVGRNGSYTITFIDPFSDTNYTPLLTLARGNESIAPFAVFIQSRSGTQLQIYTVDTLGNLLTASDGVSVVIFGN